MVRRVDHAPDSISTGSFRPWASPTSRASDSSLGSRQGRSARHVRCLDLTGCGLGFELALLLPGVMGVATEQTVHVAEPAGQVGSYEAANPERSARPRSCGTRTRTDDEE